MLEYARLVSDGAELDCDLCIVGSGPAGITLAVELRHTSLRIILLDAGETTAQPKQNTRLRAEIVPPNSHEPLEDNRRRILGGTSSAWGGRCLPLDSIDFDERSWIPNSGWPIDYRAIYEFLACASEHCEIGSPLFDMREVRAESQ